MRTCIVIGLSFHFCHRFRFAFSPLDRKRRSHKRSRKKMETFWFFRLRLCRSNDFAYESNFLFPQDNKCSYDELISSKGGNMKRTKNAAYTRKLKKKHVTFLALTSRLANNHMEIQIHETRKEKPSGKETQIFKSLCGQRYLVKQ